MIYRQNTNQAWVRGAKSLTWASSGSDGTHTCGGSFSDSGIGGITDRTEYSLNSCGGIWRQRLSSSYSGSRSSGLGSESYGNAGTHSTGT